MDEKIRGLKDFVQAQEYCRIVAPDAKETD